MNLIKRCTPRDKEILYVDVVETPSPVLMVSTHDMPVVQQVTLNEAMSFYDLDFVRNAGFKHVLKSLEHIFSAIPGKTWVMTHHIKVVLKLACVRTRWRRSISRLMNS